MLKIDEINCCGCNACVQICPKQCIQLVENHEGFLYPQINTHACIDCNLCNKVCPIHTTVESSPKPLIALAFQNSDNEVVINSSSGGAFNAIAQEIIGLGGIVFGAKFNENWSVEHSFTNNLNGIRLFQGSKYVQSDIRGMFKEAERFLKTGKYVLFSGTPCQIEGLFSFLRKDYENLYTINVSCHGVPSPLIWRRYLKENIKDFKTIKNIEFRNKRTSWNKFRLLIESKNKTIDDIHYDNPYLLGFLYNIYLRESCYNCIYKKRIFKSDLTLADYWHIDKDDSSFDITKGVSFILINTEKGVNLMRKIGRQHLTKEISINDALLSNNGLKQYTEKPIVRDTFFRDLKSNHISYQIIKSITPSPIKRLINQLKKKFHNAITK